jgi:hypothetical protein
MTDENRIARAALTRMFAPTDHVARALVARHGAYAAGYVPLSGGVCLYTVRVSSLIMLQ